MALLLIARTIAFDIDTDMDSTLGNLSDEELDGFAETHKNLASFDEVKLHIYANVLIFRRTGLVQPLEQAISRTERWIEQTPETHPERALQRRILVQILGEMSRHKLSLTSPGTATDMGLVDGSMMHDIEYAVQAAIAALDATPQDHPDRVAMLNDLSAWRGMQFNWTGQKEYLDYAVDAGTKAISATPRDHPYRHIVLTNLGSWLCMQYSYSKSLEYIHHSIDLAREALCLTPEGHPDRVMALITLGSRLHIRFTNTTSVADLDNAIEVENEALGIMPWNHPERLNALMNLGAWLGTRCELSGSEDDLNNAIHYARIALGLMPENHSARSIADRNLQFLLGMHPDPFGSALDHRSVITSDSGLSTFGSGGHVTTQTEQMHTKFHLDSSLLLHEVDKGTDLNAATKDGETSLDIADAGGGHSEAVEKLREAGAVITPSPEYRPVASETKAHRGSFQADSAGICVSLTKCKAFRDISTALYNSIPDSKMSNLTFSVHWELPVFVETELDGKWEIGSVLTVNGTISGPFATTCEKYVEEFWPSWGVEAVNSTMQSVKKVLENVSLKEPTNNISLGDKLQLCRVYPDTGRLNFELSGRRDDLVYFALLLAWLSAVFRKPLEGVVSRSSVAMKKNRFHLESMNTTAVAATKLKFDIDLLPLQDIGSEGEACCWQPMFENTVIAEDFPVRRRQGEVGLELPFSAMIELSSVLYPLQMEKGILFKGYSTALVPKSKQDSGSIQWHFVQSPDRKQPLDVDDLSDHFEQSVKDLTINKLANATAYLGYNADICIITGTRKSSYESMADFSGAEEISPSFRFGTEFSPTVGFSKLLAFNVRMAITYSHSLYAGVKAEKSRIEDKLLVSMKRPIIMYDVEKKNAFMIPELCAVLEIAHVWAKNQHDKDGFINEMPFSEPRSDGGQASHEAILKSKTLLLREAIADQPAVWLISLLRDIFDALQERRDVCRISKDKILDSIGDSAILGWELSDIAAFTESRQRAVLLHPFRKLFGKSDKKWYNIPAQNPDVIVLFYKGLEPPIQPKHEDLACRLWTPLPPGCLLATVKCLQYLSSSHNGTNDRPKLGASLFWSRPEKSKIFEPCVVRQDEGCQRAQLLEKSAPQMSLPNETAGAVIFGKAASSGILKCRTAIASQNGESRQHARTRNVSESRADWEGRHPSRQIIHNNAQRDHSTSDSDHDPSVNDAGNEYDHNSSTDQGTELTARPIQIRTSQPTLRRVKRGIHHVGS